MGRTEGEVAELASGRMEFSPEDVEALERMFLILGGPDADVGDMDGEGDGGQDFSLDYGDLGGPAAVSPAGPGSGAPGPGAGLVPVRNEGIDVDGDGVADFSLAGFGLPARPGVTWMDERERQRTNVRRARGMAIMTRFRLGIPPREQLEALATVARMELCLIASFGEAVPDPNERWDAKRVDREIERRLARLRWIESEQQKDFTGLRGIINRLRGRGRVTGKELYERIQEEADDMMMAMAEGRIVDEIGFVTQFTSQGTNRRF